MTAQEIAQALTNDPAKGITTMRVLKFVAACKRSKVAVADVLRLLPSEMVQQIQQSGVNIP